MATKKQLEEAIFQIEGFRVELEALDGARGVLQAYDWRVMAPQRWHISDWKNARLKHYRTAIRSATVLRGDGSPVTRDMQLGNLRDTYYEAEYGSLKPEEE